MPWNSLDFLLRFDKFSFHGNLKHWSSAASVRFHSEKLVWRGSQVHSCCVGKTFMYWLARRELKVSSQHLPSEIQGTKNYTVKCGSIQTPLASRENECWNCLVHLSLVWGQCSIVRCSLWPTSVFFSFLLLFASYWYDFKRSSLNWKYLNLPMKLKLQCRATLFPKNYVHILVKYILEDIIKLNKDQSFPNLNQELWIV